MLTPEALRLAEQASVESDQKKLVELVRKLCEEMDLSEVHVSPEEVS